MREGARRLQWLHPRLDLACASNASPLLAWDPLPPPPPPPHPFHDVHAPSLTEAPPVAKVTTHPCKNRPDTRESRFTTEKEREPDMTIHE